MNRIIITLMALFGLCAPTVSAAIVSGTVRDCEGNPLAGVKVSDGKAIVRTGEDGKYVMPTDKSTGYVFVSTPEGYEPAAMLVNRPKFWQMLTAAPNADEVADFTLRKVDDRRYRFLTLADIQIGRRINDVAMYHSKSVPDINETIRLSRSEGVEPFIITLGDESWDAYWYTNGYALPEIIADEERLHCKVYNVIGNHDHDPYIEGDEHSSDTWRRLMGPNYYSFDKGSVHFVVLDNIDYINEGGRQGAVGKRHYNNGISRTQLDWLKADLATVESSTPVVVAMHIPLYCEDGTYFTSNGAELCRILSSFDDVRVVTGHTHFCYAVNSSDGKIKENNYGAVCGTWWATDQADYGNNSLCRDGSPSGYAIWDVDGKNLSGIYKGVGLPADYQFRLYDGNTLEAPEQNAVYVNVWGWAPGWKIEASENGKPLNVEQVSYRDPLHVISCEKPHLALGRKNPTMASTTAHFFRMVTRKATTPVTVTVTDAEGRRLTETMVRPKSLSTDMK